jgi:transposase InsO family protein
VSRYRFVCDHRAAYPVTRLCRAAGVSRSTFYAWLSRPPSPRAVANRGLVEVIREIHDASLGTYGRVKILGQLRRRGIRVNHKRVARLMRVHAIHGVGGPGARGRRRPGRRGVAPDLIVRDFTAPAPDTRWVADLTEFPTLEGKLHLAGIMDLYSGRIVGWAMGPRRTAELAVDALVMAIARRRPPAGVIHHADNGSQYTSCSFTDRALDENVALSFGRVGTCADNAAMEAFWSTLKREVAHIHGHKVWPNRATLRAALFEYLEVFYNRARHQARLGHLTPVEYEKATVNTA